MIDFDPGAPPSIEFDKGPPIAIARHIAALPPIAAEHRDLFWYDWGPVFYRGRLNGTAKVLGIASDPGPTERLVGRTLVGDAGQRVQGFLTKLGLTTNYALVNAFPLRGAPQRDQQGPPAAVRPRPTRVAQPVLRPDHRLHACEAIIAFGGNAQAALRLWDTAPDVPTFQIPHPSAHNATDLAAKWAAAIPDARAAVTPDPGGDQTGPNYGAMITEDDYAQSRTPTSPTASRSGSATTTGDAPTHRDTTTP